MTEFEIILRVLVAMGLGILVGIERDRNVETSNNGVNEKSNLGGIRTYTTISLLGALTGLLFLGNLVIISYLLFAFIIIIINLSYVLHFLKTKAQGLTTEMATLITFVLGFMATVEVISLKFTLAFGVVIAFLLSQKTGIHRWVSRVRRREVLDVIKYFVIVLAVYPFLPNRMYLLSDFPEVFDFLRNAGIDGALFSKLQLVNPSTLWLIVVLLTGVNLFGYFLTKIFDQQRATFLTSFFAGFISSTSLINAHSLKSRETNGVKDQLRLAGGGLIAHGSSKVPILFICFIINFDYFEKILLPLGTMFLISVGVGVIMLWHSKGLSNHAEHRIDRPIFTLGPALFLAGVIAIVKLVSQIGLIFIGSAGFYVSMLVASMVGMDAISVNTAESSGSVISLELGVLTMLGAIAVNSLVKVLSSYFAGEKIFARSIAFGLCLSFFAGLLMAFQSF